MEQKEEGLDLAVATELLKTKGEEAVLHYMIKTIMKIWGVGVTEKGVIEFSNWTINYAQGFVKEQQDIDLSREDTIKNLILCSFQDMDVFLDLLRSGIISGGGELAGFDEETVKNLLAAVQNNQKEEEGI